MSDENAESIVVSPNYSGACEHASLSNDQLLQITVPKGDIIDGETLFALKYRMLPCLLNRSSSDVPNDYDHGQNRSRNEIEPGLYHATSILRFLVDEYKVNANTFLYDRNYDTYKRKYLMTKVYVDLGNYLSVVFDGGFESDIPMNNPHGLKPDSDEDNFHCFSYAKILHVPQSAERAETLLERLSKFQLYKAKTAAILRMVCHHPRLGFFTSAVRMSKPDIVDLTLNYGDEFPSVHKELLEALQEEDSSGITLLHGPAGTGKTNYLRYLMNEIKDKTLIYVPPDLVNSIAKPDFIPFLLRQPNSILIIEDAENIILDRQVSQPHIGQAVSNLLNLSDGLLGDAVHQHIICTFNCEVKNLDPALLREGRLVVEHKFDKLSVDNARRLCVELGIPGNGEDIQEPATLAEIYARKNTATEDSADPQATTKTKRRSKKKYQKQRSFFGFYT